MYDENVFLDIARWLNTSARSMHFKKAYCKQSNSLEESRKMNTGKLEHRLIDRFFSSLTKDATSILAEYRNIRPLFKTLKGEMALSASYKANTGKAPFAAPKPFAVLSSALPWAIYVAQSGVSAPSEVPAHSMCVSVLEVAYLDLIPLPHRNEVIQEMVRNWEKVHGKPVKVDLRERFALAGWDLDEIKAWSTAAAESYWQSATSSSQTSHTEPVKPLRRPTK